MTTPPCDCLEQVNKSLEFVNEAVEMTNGIILRTGEMWPAIPIPTINTKTGGRKSGRRLFAQYCPFCGQKWPTPMKKTEATQ